MALPLRSQKDIEREGLQEGFDSTSDLFRAPQYKKLPSLEKFVRMGWLGLFSPDWGILFNHRDQKEE